MQDLSKSSENDPLVDKYNLGIAGLMPSINMVLFSAMFKNMLIST